MLLAGTKVRINFQETRGAENFFTLPGISGLRNTDCFLIFALTKPHGSAAVGAHSSVGQSSGLIIRRSWDHAPLGPRRIKTCSDAGLFSFTPPPRVWADLSGGGLLHKPVLTAKSPRNRKDIFLFSLFAYLCRTYDKHGKCCLFSDCERRKFDRRENRRTSCRVISIRGYRRGAVAYFIFKVSYGLL